jgi:hypothetical protein
LQVLVESRVGDRRKEDVTWKQILVHPGITRAAANVHEWGLSAQTLPQAGNDDIRLTSSH